MSSAAFLKHPRTTPGGPGMDYQMADSEHLMKRMRAGQSDEVSLKRGRSRKFARLPYLSY